MCRIVDWLLGALLVLVSVSDIKRKTISGCLLLWLTPLVIALQIFVGNESLWSVMIGLGLGLLCFGFSRLTREAIGYGDSWLICLLGIYLGGSILLQVLLVASMGASCFSVIYGAIQGFRRKQTIPYVPFLTAAYLGVVIL